MRSEGVAHVHLTTTRQKTVRRRGRTETVTETEHHNQTEHYFTHLVPLLSARKRAVSNAICRAYFKREISEGGEGFSLSAGEHQFNFSFQLPRTAPSSYEGRHGRVRYWIRVNLRRPGKLDLVYKMPFTVNAIADLNCWPELRVSGLSTSQNQFSNVKVQVAGSMDGKYDFRLSVLRNWTLDGHH